MDSGSALATKSSPLRHRTGKPYKKIDRLSAKKTDSSQDAAATGKDPIAQAASPALRRDLWRYAVALYAQPGVAQACLSLQDRFGADVNALLFCCWLGKNRAELKTAEWQRILRLVRPLRAGIILPLRKVRLGLKPRGQFIALDTEQEKLRRTVRAAELKGEQMELYQFADFAAATCRSLIPIQQRSLSSETRIVAKQEAQISIDHYWQAARLKEPIPRPAKTAIATLIMAAFG